MPATRLELFRLFLAERDAPDHYYAALSRLALDSFPFPLAGRRVVDLGAGPGYLSAELHAAGADVVAVDLAAANVVAIAGRAIPALHADATRAPIATGSVDGVVCSNLLEHTPAPELVVAEIERVLRPGGWAWVSWTNWWSPWGGHRLSPLHYAGPCAAERLRHRLTGPLDRSIPYDTVWPTTIGRVLRVVGRTPGLRLLDACPRYYPSQRWLLRVPALREVATWNCLLLLERV